MLVLCFVFSVYILLTVSTQVVAEGTQYIYYNRKKFVCITIVANHYDITYMYINIIFLNEQVLSPHRQHPLYKLKASMQLSTVSTFLLVRQAGG